jgi:putative transposase
MVCYRRSRVPGASYFFTLALRHRRTDLLVRHIDLLRKAFVSARAKSPFSIDAIVVLPEHLHAVWTLPEGDDDYPGRWRAIKALFTREWRKRVGAAFKSPWQSRYWEHTIRDEKDFARHIDYVHFNPVKHGHVDKVIDWPYSSFHRYVEAQIYTRDWGGLDETGAFGEPR